MNMASSILIDEITINLSSKLEYLHLAARFSREVCCSIGNKKIDDEFINAVELVISEACTNAIRHSGMGGSGRIVLVFQIFTDRLVIKVKDQGEGFDITQVPDPDFDEFAEGGYGLYIIKSKMDSVDYETEGTWNVLSMTKQFHRSAEEKDTEL